jgi:hypothetical protein
MIKQKIKDLNMAASELAHKAFEAFGYPAVEYIHQSYIVSHQAVRDIIFLPKSYNPTKGFTLFMEDEGDLPLINDYLKSGIFWIKMKRGII